MTAPGRCPSCGATGAAGAACSRSLCRERGCHYIPSSYYELHAARAAADASPLVGQSVDEYLVVDRIGAGGFGQVLLALQMPIGMKSALKLIHAERGDDRRTEMMLAKFEGEARALATLTHPNIVRLLKYGSWGGRPYLVMEFVEGGAGMRGALYANPRAGRGLASPQAVGHALHQILHALEAAHSRGIIHRDIKPDNVLLQAVAGDRYHVKVLDFGLAKFVEEGNDTSLAIGTPGYMAPEQLRSTGLGPWTDLYAVGVMAFEMLTGRWPFEGRSAEVLLACKLDPSFDPIEQLEGATLPAAAVAFLRKALAHDPADRYRDAASFRADLDTALAALGSARTTASLLPPDAEGPDPVTEHRPTAAAPTRRPRPGWHYLVAGALAALPVMLGAWWLTRDPPPAASASGSDGAVERTRPPATGIRAPDGWAVAPAGTFVMGSPADEAGRASDEGPSHRVEITRPLLVKATEVTVAEWEALLGNRPSKFSCGPDCPVTNVTFWDALAYANAASLRDGLHECYNLRGCEGTPGEQMECASVTFKGLGCSGYRLPTEAEWEYAARAGTQTPTWAGGLTLKSPNHAPELDAIAWYAGNSGAEYEGAEDCSGWPDKPHDAPRCGPHPVASKAANPLGLFDMLGNVWEWTWDYKGPYPDEASIDPVGPARGEERVNRGGAWNPEAKFLRSAARGSATPGYSCVGLGFRLVRTAAP